MGLAPLVSVIIPTYNRAHIVGAAIESVLNQTYSRTEIIVVDDGSTDDTGKILLRFGDRIKVVTQKNAGPGAARNHGIRISKGEVIAFLDSDDLWLPTKLERQVSLLQHVGDEIPCCLCNTHLHLADGRTASAFDVAMIKPKEEEGIWQNVLEVLSNRFVLFNQSVAIRRAALEKAGGFNERLWCMEDYDLALRLALIGPWAFVRQPLTIWNQGSSESLSRRAETNRSEFAEISASICQDILTKLSAENASKIQRDWVASRSKQMRRIAMAMRLRAAQFWGARIVGAALDGIERSRAAIYQRSPWFSKMKTRPVDLREQS